MMLSPCASIVASEVFAGKVTTPGPETLRVTDLSFVVLVRVQTSEPVIFRMVDPSGASLNVPYCLSTGMSTCTTKPHTLSAMSKGDDGRNTRGGALYAHAEHDESRPTDATARIRATIG